MEGCNMICYSIFNSLQYFSICKLSALNKLVNKKNLILIERIEEYLNFSVVKVDLNEGGIIEKRYLTQRY